MSRELRRVVWLLGLHQCLVWGLLYYLFTLLLLPVAEEFVASREAVAAAFSLGLAAAAGAATPVGRWIDRGHGARVMNAATALAVLGLLLAALAPGLPVFMVAWLVLGLAMAGLLYEPAFALLVRAMPDSGERLRALAAVSVLGSLASTLCLPPMHLLIETLGWRSGLCVFAGLLALIGLLFARGVLPVLLAAAGPAVEQGVVAAPPLEVAVRRDARLLDGSFALSTLAAVMLIALLVPLAADRGEAVWGVWLAAAWGLLQLPGRVFLLLHGRVPQAPLRLPLVLQALGLLLLTVAERRDVMLLAVALVAIGAGLMTLARPWWVARRFGHQRAAAISGRMARHSGLARAAGPWLAVVGYQQLGAGTLFLLLAVALLLPWWLLGRGQLMPAAGSRKDA